MSSGGRGSSGRSGTSCEAQAADQEYRRVYHNSAREIGTGEAMKIVYIVNHLAPYRLAGTEVATDKYARHLSERGHEVHVIIIREEGIPPFEARSERYFVHAIPFTRRFTYTFGEVLYFLRILLLVKEITPDIVHAQMIKNGRFAVLLRWILGIPAVTAPRGSDIYTSPDWFLRTVGRWVLNGSTRVGALSEDMRTRILRYANPAGITIIPNGIDPPSESKKESDPGSRRDGILYVGRLHPVKGVKHLISAMKTVIAVFPDTRLTIIGDGEERGRLGSIVCNLGLTANIEFLGSILNEQVKELMGKSKLLVLPSISEAFPNVILESMAAGTPVIASRVGGIPSFVRQGINGFLVPPGDPVTLSERIITLLGDDPLREIMGKNAIDAAGKYLWPNIIPMLEGMYEEILDERTRGKSW